MHNYVARRHRVQLYKISRDPVVARKWLDACGFESIPVSPSTSTFKVCREHFIPSDFEGPATLRSDAVPSLYTTYSPNSTKRFRPDMTNIRPKQSTPTIQNCRTSAILSHRSPLFSKRGLLKDHDTYCHRSSHATWCGQSAWNSSWSVSIMITPILFRLSIEPTIPMACLRKYAILWIVYDIHRLLLLHVVRTIWRTKTKSSMIGGWKEGKTRVDQRSTRSSFVMVEENHLDLSTPQQCQSRSIITSTALSNAENYSSLFFAILSEHLQACNAILTRTTTTSKTECRSPERSTVIVVFPERRSLSTCS